ncbi:MAG: hypothetical protein MUC28_01665, partial [Planctomycetes bacterium]|nr:hypothetical protein [Planctomycetota bacterium]
MKYLKPTTRLLRKVITSVTLFTLVLSYFYTPLPEIIRGAVPEPVKKIVRAPEIGEARANPGTRANTVMVYGGQWSTDGTSPRVEGTNYSFGTTTFQLAEASADIKDAYIVLEAQLNGTADSDGDITGHAIAFDACESCAVLNPWGSGAGQVVQDQLTTVLGYEDVDGHNYVRLIATATAESAIAAYAGAGTPLSFQIGYKFESNTASADIIDSVKARLVITYTYDDTSESFTNTVMYPLDSADTTPTPDDLGSTQTSEATACTRDSTCPQFAFTPTIPELTSSSTQRVSAWYVAGGQNDSNGTTDATININLESNDANSSNFIMESGEGSAQGMWPEGWWAAPSLYETASQLDFTENQSNTLEIYAGGTGLNMRTEMAEIYVTYIASSSESTKTRTVAFPMGKVSSGNSTAVQYKETSVYLKEDGIDVKSAWLKIIAHSDLSGTYTYGVAYKAGAQATSSTYTYNIDPGANPVDVRHKVIQIIDPADYGALEAATTSPVKVALSVTPSNAAIDGVSAILYLTYTYTGETDGYMQTLYLSAGQSYAAGNDQSEALTTGPAPMPETTGTKTVRGAALNASYAISDSADSFNNADISLDANIAVSSPTCSDARLIETEDQCAFGEFYRDVTSGMSTTDGQVYEVCLTNDGG